jgi:hypothetical protein
LVVQGVEDTEMTADNLINLAEYRRPGLKAGPDRNAQRDADRSNEVAELLKKLRSTKRIAKNDQQLLVANLGRLVVRLDPGNPMALAERILGSEYWAKRKRYIRFPNDAVGAAARYAASGGTFAKLVERLVDEKVRKGFTHAQAQIEIVYEALKGTSFRPPSRFQMLEAPADTVHLIKNMEPILDSLAQDASLAEYFDLVSKYPIYPVEDMCSRDPRLSGRSLELRADREPNDLYEWDSYVEDDELQNWIPWWAPKCVIGHMYVPFDCRSFDLPEDGVLKIKEICRGEITHETWISDECSRIVDRLRSSAWIKPDTIYHRLPVWLTLLPSAGTIIPCFYISIYYRDDFQIEQSLNDSTYDNCDDLITPCFVDYIWDRIDHDTKYFSSNDLEEDTLYVLASKAHVKIIDSGVGKAEVLDASFIDDLPHWLHGHPIQRILKLTMDSDEAKLFALSARIFHKDLACPSRVIGNNETVFRPAFSDPVQYVPPLRQNTLAAYLMRNFVDAGKDNIFGALKRDALAKFLVAKEVIAGELSKFQSAFDCRYGK